MMLMPIREYFSGNNFSFSGHPSEYLDPIQLPESNSKALMRIDEFMIIDLKTGLITEPTALTRALNREISRQTIVTLMKEVIINGQFAVELHYKDHDQVKVCVFDRDGNKLLVLPSQESRVARNTYNETKVVSVNKFSVTLITTRNGEQQRKMFLTHDHSMKVFVIHNFVIMKSSREGHSLLFEIREEPLPVA